MAERGRPVGGRLDDASRQRVLRLRAIYPIREIARRLDHSRNTVRKILRNAVAN